MNSKKKFLFVLTSHGQLGDTYEKTGFHFREMTQPYYILQDHGIQVDIASIKGGFPPIEPSSLKKQSESGDRFKNDPMAMKKLKFSIKIDDIDINNYEGIYLPGGHGAMWDFPNNKALRNAIESAWKQGKVIAAVSHGPAALVDAQDERGVPIVKDRRVNAFTNEEEEAVMKHKAVIFQLESRLREQGAFFEWETPFQGILVQESTLITGQNPKSAGLVANAILRSLGISPYDDVQTTEQKKV